MKKVLVILFTLISLFVFVSCAQENSKVYLQFEAKASDEKVEDQNVLKAFEDLYSKITNRANSKIYVNSYSEIEQDGATYKKEANYSIEIKSIMDAKITYNEYLEKKSSVGTEYLTKKGKIESLKDTYSVKGKLYLNNKFENIDDKNKDEASSYIMDFNIRFSVSANFDFFKFDQNNVYRQGTTLYSKAENGYIIFLKNKIIFKYLNMKSIIYVVF